MRRNALILVILTASVGGLHADWLIKQVSNVGSGLQYGNLVLGDADHDGRAELSFYRYTDAQDGYLWQTWEYRPFNRFDCVRSETCIVYPAYPPPGMHKGLFIPTDIGDADGDGLTEILGFNQEYFGDSTVIDSFRSYLCIYESPMANSYADSLVWRHYLGTNVIRYPLAWFPGDMDHDGHREILFSNDLNTVILENCGNDQNESVFATPFGHVGYSYAFGDFDQDGHEEFVTAVPGARPWPVLVYRCTGDDQYSLVDSIVPPCGNGYDIFSGFNLSGSSKPEFFVVYDRYNGQSCKFIPCMYESDGAGGYNETIIDSIPTVEALSTKHSVCADIDGDGQQELIVACGQCVCVYKPLGNSQFQKVWMWINPEPTEPQTYILCSDLNGDGYPEIIISGNANTRLFEMEAVRVIYPNGGQQFFTGDTCRIRWHVFTPPRCDSLSLFYTTDNGATYRPIAHNLAPSDTLYPWTIPDVQGESCKVKVIAYGPGWQFDESNACFSMTRLAVGEQKSPQVRTTSLIGIQPNPVASNGQVWFQLKDECEVTLRICDVSGRTVATLADGVLKPGVYRRDWEVAPTVPNGIYFVRLQTPNYAESKKLILTQ